MYISSPDTSASGLLYRELGCNIRPKWESINPPISEERMPSVLWDQTHIGFIRLEYLQDNFIQWWCFPSFWPAWKYLSEEKKLCCWTRLLFFFFSFRKLKPLHCFLQLMYIVHIESGNQKKQYWYYSWKHRQWHVLPTCTKKGSNSNFGRIKLSPCA